MTTTTCVLRSFIIALTFGALGACTTIPVDQRDEIREEVNQAGEETIARMVADDPEIQASLDGAVGYLAARISTTKLPIVGGGYGFGVLHDKENSTRTYLNVTRYDLGAGLGAGRYRALVVFDTREALERFRGGTWTLALGAESAAGTHATGRVTTLGDGYSLHIISDAGAAVAITARMIDLSVNHDLTDTGVSEVSIPNTGFVSTGGQGEDAPRVWDHKLPFMAQKVIDQGYDLPLPYGIGLTYANVEQEQLLSSLQVGINGADLEPFDFVSFDNAMSNSDSFSIKADAWLFPFMNVFAMIGRVDGEAPMDVLIDGNGMLDQLGIDCQGFPPSPLCAILEDQNFALPITAKFEGNTYGIWATLAGGWHNWFVTIPFNWTYADIDGNDTDGVNFTATPRVGYVFNLGRKGNLAVFVGGNYLDSDLTVDGSVSTPDGLLEIDYLIDQENKDKWNALLGFNWDINKRLSWSAEYDGFTGSRDAFITSVSWKY
jgi:hypothetical protein